VLLVLDVVIELIWIFFKTLFVYALEKKTPLKFTRITIFKKKVSNGVKITRYYTTQFLERRSYMMGNFFLVLIIVPYIVFSNHLNANLRF